MSKIFEHLSPPAIKISVQRLACFDCGSETNVTCSCGVAYLPKAIQAAEAITADPVKSNRQIAEETGLSEATVRRARAGASHDAPEERTGRDGKSYPAAKPKPVRPPMRVELDRGISLFLDFFRSLSIDDRNIVQDGIDKIRLTESNEDGS